MPCRLCNRPFHSHSHAPCSVGTALCGCAVLCRQLGDGSAGDHREVTPLSGVQPRSPAEPTVQETYVTWAAGLVPNPKK